eukprot:scaffold5115_cov146-Skeletonema_menzelii.AAC.5
MTSSSSDDVNETSTPAPVSDERGTALRSPVPQSAAATGPNRATPSPPAQQRSSSESNDESASTQLQLDGDTRNDEQEGEGEFQCAAAGALHYYI